MHAGACELPHSPICSLQRLQRASRLDQAAVSDGAVKTHMMSAVLRPCKPQHFRPRDSGGVLDAAADTDSSVAQPRSNIGMKRNKKSADRLSNALLRNNCSLRQIQRYFEIPGPAPVSAGLERISSNAIVVDRSPIVDEARPQCSFHTQASPEKHQSSSSKRS